MEKFKSKCVVHTKLKNKNNTICVVHTKLMNKNKTMLMFFSWENSLLSGKENIWICCHDLVASECGLVAGNRFWPRASQWWADRQEVVGKKLWGECWQNNNQGDHKRPTNNQKDWTLSADAFGFCLAKAVVTHRSCEDAYHGKLHPVLEGLVWGREV